MFIEYLHSNFLTGQIPDDTNKEKTNKTNITLNKLFTDANQGPHVYQKAEFVQKERDKKGRTHACCTVLVMLSK